MKTAKVRHPMEAFSSLRLNCMLLFFALAGSIPLAGQNSPLWQDIAPEVMRTSGGDRKIVPAEYRALELNVRDMQLMLRTAPQEAATPLLRSNMILPVPLAEGSTERYQLVEYVLLHPELSARYPEIKTFRGVSTTNPANTIRVTWSALGFEALIMREDGTMAISPVYRGNQQYYQSYYKKALPVDPDFVCHVENKAPSEIEPAEAMANIGPCGNLRTFRTAMAASGEYSALVSPNNTKAEVLGEITNLMNAMNAVYEKDLAVRMTLIANNDAIIYLDGGTDPFTSQDLGTLIDQNQTNIDNVIGSDNYDIGHLLLDFGGGLAGPTPCIDGQEARGVSGTGNPIGVTFYIDLVAHEIGHQFGANHTFNGTTSSCGGGNRNLATAYEPGSGTTIMAYAGICGAQNVQSNSDPYFHNTSLLEMQNLIATWSTCAVLTANGNTVPTVDAGADITIPTSTPFKLTATGTGVNTYAWEQFDNESSTQPPVSTSTGGPNFRTFNPTASASRDFPSLANQIAGTTTWEVLPSVARTMNFKVTARDNVATGGCTAEDLMVVTFADSDPFVVTAPNTAVTWDVGSNQNVTWNVAATAAAPVSCANVDILLSTDGGLTYPIVLATSVANDGSHSIVVPNNSTSFARVQIKCSTSIFYDISDTNFTIGEGGGVPACDAAAVALTCGQAYNGDTNTGTNTFGSYPACIDWDESGKEIVHKITTTATGDITATLTNLASGDLDVFILGSCDDVASCKASGDVLATANSQPAGTYYIVVDGFGGASSTYTLTVTSTATCEETGGNGGTCADPLALNCGDNIMGNTADGGNNIEAHASSTGYTGPELIYQFTAPAGIMDIQLTGLAADLGLFLVTDCNDPINTAVASSENSGISTEGINLNVSAGTYYIIVDGYQGAQSTFNLALTCGGDSGSGGCNTYNSTDTPKTIDPDAPPTIVTSVINIPAGENIDDVNITLQGTHSFISDLTFTLQSPQGTTITLLSGQCDSQVDFNITLDDEAAGAITCPLNAGNTQQPENALSAFNGQNAAGNWTLTITDDIDADGGQLTSWSLEICTGEGGGGNCDTPPPASGTIAAGTYQTSTSISTAGQILAPSTVVFKAENSITLTPGFVAQQGSSFTATIEACLAAKPVRSTIALRPEKEEVAPEKTTLTVFPNPFRNQATVRYYLAKASAVSIDVFDVNGQRVAQPVQQSQQARGDYQFTFNAIDYSQGMYVIFLRTKETVVAKRLILLE